MELMKLCVECANRVSNFYEYKDECQSSEAEIYRNIVTGAWPSCSSMREDEGRCGKSAKWYKGKGRMGKK